MQGAAPESEDLGFPFFPLAMKLLGDSLRKSLGVGTWIHGVF